MYIKYLFEEGISLPFLYDNKEIKKRGLGGYNKR